MTNLEVECKGLWQACIQKIWQGHCIWCGKPKPISGHHIIPRGYYLSKFELMNSAGVCVACHNKIHGEAGAEAEFMKHIEDNWPDLWAWHEEWRPKAVQSYGGWSKDELREIRAKLKEFLNDNN